MWLLSHHNSRTEEPTEIKWPKKLLIFTMALYVESLLNPSKNKEEEKEKEIFVLVFLSQGSFSYAIRVISLKGQRPRFISMVHKIP